MRFLQIKKDGVSIPPEILEMNGVDFDTIRYCSKDNQYLTFIDGNLDDIVNSSDCYQSRPLIEIDGFCEFDIILSNEYYQVDVTSTKIILFLPSLIIKNLFDDFYEEDYNDRFYTVIDGDYKTLGTIFNPENQAKYLKLYQ